MKKTMVLILIIIAMIGFSMLLPMIAQADVGPDLKLEWNPYSYSIMSWQETKLIYIKIRHTEISNADAYNVKLKNVLSDNWHCKGTGYVINYPGNPGSTAYNGDEVIFGESGNIDIPLGPIDSPNYESYGDYYFYIYFDVDLSIEPDGILSNNLTLEWEDEIGNIYSNDYIIEINEDDPTALTKNVIGSPRYAIGEEIEYKLDLKVRRGTTRNVVVKDQIPEKLEFVEWSVDNRDNISYTNTLPHPLSDTGELTWDFGTITNDVQDNKTDIISITYKVRVKNDISNQEGVVKNSQVYATYTNGLNEADKTSTVNQSFTIKEPVLTVNKSYEAGRWDGGDSVLCSIEVENNSSVSAYDIDINDIIPEGLSYVTDSMSPVGTYDSDVVSWNIDELAGNNSIRFTYDVIVPDDVEPGQDFTSEVQTSWSSLPGTDSNERTGADGAGGVLNDYAAVEESTLSVYDETELSKSINDGFKYSIGQVVSYTLKLDLIEGITKGVVVKDILPAGMKLCSAAVVKDNENITYNLTTEPAEGVRGELIWDFGDVVNPVNNDSSDDMIEIQYTALIEDIVENVRGTAFNNAAQLRYIDGNGDEQIIEQAIEVAIVEPELKVEVEEITTGPYDAGDTISYKVTVSHTGESNGIAYDVRITDIISEGLSYDSYTANPNDPGNPSEVDNRVVFGEAGNIDIDPEESFVFNINVKPDIEIEPRQEVNNSSIQVDYSSTDGANIYERQYIANSVSTKNMIIDDKTDLTKKVLGEPNYGLGDEIPFQLIISINGGTTEGVVVKDTLSEGIEFRSPTIVKGNEGIICNLPEEPVMGDNGELTWDLGTVVNPGNENDADDIIIIEYKGLIKIGGDNKKGKALTSKAHLEYIDAKDNPQTTDIQELTYIIANKPPIVHGVSIATKKNTEYSGILSAEDIDIEDILTYSIVNDPVHGKIILDEDGKYTYKPDDNYYGSDSFTFKANDGSADSNTAIVNITVVAPKSTTKTYFKKSDIKTEADKALDKSMLSEDEAKISLQNNEDDGVQLTPNIMQTLVDEDKPLVLDNRDIRLDFNSQSLATSELAEALKEQDAKLELGAKALTDEEKHDILGNASLGESTGVFEVGGKIFDLTAQITRKNLDGRKVVDKIDEFREPVAVTIDLSDLELTDEDISKLTGIRYENDDDGNIISIKLGGEYDPKAKTFTFYTDKFSFYSVVKADEVTEIALIIGKLESKVNGKMITNDTAPIIINDRTMVPVRFIAESLGAEVEWIGETRTVVIKLEEQTLTMVIDQPIEGFDTPPTIVNNRTLVPLRYVSEKLGANVLWFQSTKAVYIVR